MTAVSKTYCAVQSCWVIQDDRKHGQENLYAVILIRREKMDQVRSEG